MRVQEHGLLRNGEWNSFVISQCAWNGGRRDAGERFTILIPSDEYLESGHAPDSSRGQGRGS